MHCRKIVFLAQVCYNDKKETEVSRMDQAQAPVAVFDSGVGGVSVLRELVRCMPQEHFLYFGDSVHAPYGARSTQEVRALTLAAAKMLFDRGVKALVVACNTATAAAIEVLRSTWPEKIIVGIEPALKLAVERHMGGRVAVMGTSVTIREQKFHTLLERFRTDSEIIPLACPGLVELIEAGQTAGERVSGLLRQELESALDKPLDAVVLGCTHYPFVKKEIRRIVGERPEILDGGTGTARHTQHRLAEAGLLKDHGVGSVMIENSLDGKMVELSRRLLDAPWGENALANGSPP
jgi:glutamate racemase